MYFTDEPSYSEGHNAYCLCKALSDRDVELTILSPSASPTVSIEGATIIGLGDFEVSRDLRYYALRWFRYNIEVLGRAKRLLREIEPDLVHHMFPSWIDYGFSFYPILNQTRPFIYGPILTQTSGAVPPAMAPKDHLTAAYRKAFSRRLYVQTLRRATRVIVSLEDAFGYLPRFVRDKSVTICHGVDSRLFHPSTRRAENSAFNVVFLGRLVPFKGASVAIRAVSQIKERIPNIVLAIAGVGPQRDELETLARSEGVEDSVRFLGFVEGSRVPSLLRNSDVLCCPSIADASPTVILQGMACGLPIVASNVGGISEMVGHGASGLLVEPDNEMKLSEAFVKLHEDSELRRRLGDDGRLRVEREYDWDVIAKRMVGLYRESVQ